MVQKLGEINLFFTTFVNKTTMDSFGLFHQHFEPLKIPPKHIEWQPNNSQDTVFDENG